MNVLLVGMPNPKLFDVVQTWVLMEPLALEYLAAAIKPDHNVKVIDPRFSSEPTIQEAMETFKPDIIGVGPFVSFVNDAKKVLAEAKKLSPQVLTVVGGIHASVRPTDFFEDYVDIIVVGEGVSPFKKLCDHQEKRKSFEDIENIYYRKDGRLVFSRKEDFPPLDTLPFPDRTVTAHLRGHYNVLINELTPWASIRGTAGCYYRCKYCAASSFRGHKVYRRSNENIIAELESIKESLIMWVDEEMLLECDKAISLARAIGKAGIKKAHFSFARADTIIKRPDTVEAWAKVGLKSVFIGFESHKDKDLKEMKKASTISMNDEAINICHANGVQVWGSFMLKCDYEKKDFRSLTRYAREIGVDKPMFSIYTPIPGTELYEEMKDQLVTHNYDLFDIQHAVLPTKLPIKQFYKEYLRLMLRAVPLAKKIKFLRKADPSLRKEMYKYAVEVRKKFKNAYKDYELVESKSLA